MPESGFANAFHPLNNELRRHQLVNLIRMAYAVTLVSAFQSPGLRCKCGPKLLFVLRC